MSCIGFSTDTWHTVVKQLMPSLINMDVVHAQSTLSAAILGLFKLLKQVCPQLTHNIF